MIYFTNLTSPNKTSIILLLHKNEKAFDHSWLYFQPSHVGSDFCSLNRLLELAIFIIESELFRSTILIKTLL
jgi:hypothetical protein